MPHPELDFSFQVWDSSGFLTFSEHIVGVSDNFEGPPQTVESFCSEPREVAGAPECTQRNCSIRFSGQTDFQFITFFNCEGEILVADPEVTGLGTPVFDAQSMYDACLSIPTNKFADELSSRKAQDHQDYKQSIEKNSWAIAGLLTIGLAALPAGGGASIPFIARGTFTAATTQVVLATFTAIKDKFFPNRTTYQFALDQGCKVLQAERHCYLEATTAFPLDSLPPKDEAALKNLIESAGANGNKVWDQCRVGDATP